MELLDHSDLFSKRNITKNISSIGMGNHLRKNAFLFLAGLIFFTASVGFSSCSSQKNISQRKIEKERERKDKESRKKYDQAIKQHEKNQSAATRSMMKETKKESPKNTPLKKSNGKKCK